MSQILILRTWLLTWGLWITVKHRFSTRTKGGRVIHSSVRQVVDLVHARLRSGIDQLMHLVAWLRLNRQMVDRLPAMTCVSHLNGDEPPCLKLVTVLVEAVLADVRFLQDRLGRWEGNAALAGERGEVRVEPLCLDGQLRQAREHLR